MPNSKHLASLIGPTLIAVTVSETVNLHIWTANTAAGVHLNGALLFVAGLAIVRAHNLWTRNWPVLVTLSGWFALLLGLFRMFLPERQLQGAHNSYVVLGMALLVLAVGVLLTFKAYGSRK